MIDLGPEQNAGWSPTPQNSGRVSGLLSRHDLICAAIVGCARATQPDRHLDALIALAVFPGLAELRRLGAGVWLRPDGSRVRALRYSSLPAAAKTLVPSGYWIESTCTGVIVVGAEGAWSGRHAIEAISICLAALRARDAICDCEDSTHAFFQENIHG